MLNKLKRLAKLAEHIPPRKREHYEYLLNSIMADYFILENKLNKVQASKHKTDVDKFVDETDRLWIINKVCFGELLLADFSAEFCAFILQNEKCINPNTTFNEYHEMAKNYKIFTALHDHKPTDINELMLFISEVKKEFDSENK